jgi:hypothetical protein
VSLRILVSGMLAGVPHQGGASWAVLQYVLGLRRLGHRVTFVEPVAALRQPSTAYFERVVAGFGLRAALLDTLTGETVGVPRRALADADVLLNLSGLLADEELMERIPVRAFVDLDPGFTQLWSAVEGVELGFARHNRFVTIGSAIGSDGCAVPTCGLEWITTPQPIALDHWPVAERLLHDAATTVGHWRSYGSIEAAGVRYGQKAHAMRELLDVPALASVRVSPALSIHPGERADLDALRRHGWRLLDPRAVASDPWDYRSFVQGSWAELGVAKSGYVAAACGWFSDRSVCYLASGRPVVAQDTGFGAVVPAGEGVLAFRTADEAAAGLEAVRSDYERHRRAARTIAEEVFDSGRVLTRLLACL